MSHESFIQSTLHRFDKFLSRSALSEHAAAQPGLVQQFDPRVRLLGLLSLVVATVVCRRIEMLAGLFVLAVLIAATSRLSLLSLARSLWLAVLAFTGIAALPALFLTPGDPVVSLPVLGWSITAQGTRTVTLLILRAETSVTLMATLVLCTPWNHLLKSLRVLRIPAEAITLLAMTHRYLFLLVATVTQMYESRQSRAVGTLSRGQSQGMAVRTAAVLMSKSIDLSHEVYLAMLSRGFRGEVFLLHDFRMRTLDYLGMMVFLALGTLAVWQGR